jgi:hypothetical protein
MNSFKHVDLTVCLDKEKGNMYRNLAVKVLDGGYF